MYLIIIFLIAFTFAELYLLIHIGQLIGVFNTVSLIVLTGIAGLFLARSQGFSLITRLKNDLEMGIMPTDVVTEGLLIFIGALLLIIPGFLTDIIGLLLVIPFTRVYLRDMINYKYRDRLKEIIEREKRKAERDRLDE